MQRTVKESKLGLINIGIVLIIIKFIGKQNREWNLKINFREEF